MSSKSIRVSAHLHEALSNLKREGESYEELLKRLIRNNRLSNFAGLWSGLSDEEKDRIRNSLKHIQMRSPRE
jgi:predicted CopG family antitoxin